MVIGGAAVEFSAARASKTARSPADRRCVRLTTEEPEVAASGQAAAGAPRVVPATAPPPASLHPRRRAPKTSGHLPARREDSLRFREPGRPRVGSRRPVSRVEVLVALASFAAGAPPPSSPVLSRLASKTARSSGDRHCVLLTTGRSEAAPSGQASAGTPRGVSAGATAPPPASLAPRRRAPKIQRAPPGPAGGLPSLPGTGAPRVGSQRPVSRVEVLVALASRRSATVSAGSFAVRGRR